MTDILNAGLRQKCVLIMGMTELFVLILIEIFVLGTAV